MHPSAHRWANPILFVCLAQAAFAAPPKAPANLTVAEFDALVASLRQQSDGKAARGLARVTLKERAGADQVARWEADFQGSRAREALLAVTDASAFQNPPAAEILHNSPPDAAAAQQIVAKAVDYVKQVMPKLPNFSALRATSSFEIATQAQLDSQKLMGNLVQQSHKAKPNYQSLGPAESTGMRDAQIFWTGSNSKLVTNREGFEVTESPGATAGQGDQGSLNMVTIGEFGPILSVITLEALPDKMAWNRWEQGPAGPLAVFDYAVPRARSHFAVEFNLNEPPDFPAYHGEIAIDPASGAIFRITIVANMHEPDTLRQVHLTVEYEHVTIGGVPYICPVHGVAMVSLLDQYADENAQPPPIPFKVTINDVSFTHYHLFRSESHVLNGAIGR